MRLVDFAKARPTRAYFLLACALPWGAVLLLLAWRRFTAAPDVPDGFFMILFPAMAIAPPLAACLVTWVAEGRAGFAAYLHRVLTARAHAVWYLFAVCAIPLTAAAVLGTLALIWPQFTPGVVMDFNTQTLIAGLAAGLITGFLEECGWTAFALHRVLKHCSVIMAGLIVGAVHGVWHFPAGALGEAPRYSVLFLTYFVVFWIFGLTALRMLIAWMYRQTAALLPAQLMHASYTSALFLLWPSGTTAFQDTLWTALFTTALWALVAVIAFSHRVEFFRPREGAVPALVWRE
jgi:uncharacterized protein